MKIYDVDITIPRPLRKKTINGIVYYFSVLDDGCRVREAWVSSVENKKERKE